MKAQRPPRKRTGLNHRRGVRPTSRLVFVLFVSVVLARPATLAASPTQDFYITQALGRYFVLPYDAETLSLGRSSEAVCRSASCLYLNPAGLGALPASELGGTVGTSENTGTEFLSGDPLDQDTLHGFASAALRLGGDGRGPARFGTLALGYSRYDGDGAGADRATPDGHRRSVGYGVALGDALALGYAFHWYDDQLRSRLADLHSTSRILHVWGVQLDLPRNLRLGGSFRLGVGQSDTEDFRLASDGHSHLREHTAVIGVEKRLGPWRALAGFDFTNLSTRGLLAAVTPTVVIGGSEAGSRYDLRVGIERAVGDDLRLRAGFVHRAVESYEFRRPDLESLSGSGRGPGFSAGVGVLLGGRGEAGERVRLDYGVEYLSVGNGSFEHILSVAVPLAL